MGKSSPRLLDLGCKACGAAVGYVRAGFEVVGVDIEPQPNYPFRFIQDDMLTCSLEGFDAYHVSALCERFSLASWFHHSHDRHPDLVTPMRERLRATGKPYVLENVVGAPLVAPLLLCGAMFGLRVYRHLGSLKVTSSSFVTLIFATG